MAAFEVTPVSTIEERIASIVRGHRTKLHVQIALRREELLQDDLRHQEAYQILGMDAEECIRIDLFQNVGRFVYKYAGQMFEDVTRVLLGFPDDGKPLKIPNAVSESPTQFHIDCFTAGDNRAHEVKWRDATTDGDHVRKERDKIVSIVEAGHVPVRIMYYMPVRSNAIRIQEKVLSAFREHGEAYVGEEAWEYVRERSGVDLHSLMQELIQE